MNAPLDKQMKFAFMDGGAVGEVDPVSGNPVPPGSEPENVRDDIDAKLSEGEYVIPANVVNFYGIDKFRKMIQKAEEQLAEMDQEGQIGGDPVVEEAPVEDLPFDVSELAVAEDTAPLEMATGGVVYNPNASRTAGGIENRVYTNDAGAKRTFLFFNGMPITGIPAGWYPDTIQNRKAMQGEDPKTISPTVPQESSADKKLGQDQEKKVHANVTEWTTEDFEKFADQQMIVDTFSRGMGLAGPGGLLIGAAMRKGNEHTMGKAMDELMARIQNPETPQEDRDRLQKVYTKFSEKGEDDGGGIFGGGLMDNLFGENGFFGMFGSKKETQTPEKPSISPFKSTRTGAAAPSGQHKSDPIDTSSRAPSISPRPASRPTQQTSTPDRGTTQQRSASSGTGYDATTHGFESNDPRSAGYKKGGYVKRRKK